MPPDVTVPMHLMQPHCPDAGWYVPAGQTLQAQVGQVKWQAEGLRERASRNSMLHS